MENPKDWVWMIKIIKRDFIRDNPDTELSDEEMDEVIAENLEKAEEQYLISQSEGS